jgi:hypothetical protein
MMINEILDSITDLEILRTLISLRVCGLNGKFNGTFCAINKVRVRGPDCTLRQSSALIKLAIS